jgi:hypothetical protein
MESNAAGRKTLNFILTPSEHNYWCAEKNANQFTIPYLSVGAHRYNGNGQTIGKINKSKNTGSHMLRFKATIRGYIPPGCAAGTSDICLPGDAGVHSGVLLAAQWSGVRRMVFLDLHAAGVLYNTTPEHAKWNWPIYESMFWPGGDIAILNAGAMSTNCGFSVPTLPTNNTQVTYALNMSKIFKCASDLGLFTASMPAGGIDVESVDWFVEAVGTAGGTWIAIDDPSIGS